jgi:hypothetical protein
MDDWTRFIRADGKAPDASSFVTLRRVATAFNAHFIRASGKLVIGGMKRD